MTARFLVMVAAIAILGGCSPALDLAATDQGFDGVKDSAAVLGQETAWVQNRAEAQTVETRVKALLAQDKVLGVEAAVAIALVNNKGLQAAYADLGEAGADLWQSTLLINPKAAIGLSGIGTPGLQAYRAMEGMLAVNILALATRQQTVEIATLRFRQAQHAAALKTLSLAAETRKAWIKAVAAREIVTVISKARTAADAASELAQKLGETGAMTKAAQSREHAFLAELSGQLAEARLAERLAREELTRLMGLWGRDIDYRLPSNLPSLPGKLVPTTIIEAEALANRLDLKMARLELEATAKAYGLTAATRLVRDLELVGGLEAEREKEGGKVHVEVTGSKELEFLIPIFDSGKARLRKAEMAYLRAANQLAERAVNVRSEARATHEAYRSSHAIARHYRDTLVPLRSSIEQESLLTYNGMITNTFELLADTRETINARQRAILAKRDFWIAAANLTTAIHGGGSTVAAAEIATTAPSDDGGGH